MIFERVCAIIAEQFGVELASLSAQTSFEGDLGADSIDIVELSMALEEEFGIEEMEESDVSSILTVGDLMKYLQARLDEM